MDNLDMFPIWVKIQEEGTISAIKLARDTFDLPLITAKCLVEIVKIIRGDTTCPHCRVAIDKNDLRVPVTIQVRRNYAERNK